MLILKDAALTPWNVPWPPPSRPGLSPAALGAKGTCLRWRRWPPGHPDLHWPEPRLPGIKVPLITYMWDMSLMLESLAINNS